MDDAEAATLADYFSLQKPTQPSSSGLLAEAGRKIFEGGRPANSGSACPLLYLPRAERPRAWRGTRIAGHQDYLTNQFQVFILGLHVGTPMNNHSWALTPEQMRAVTTYLSNN
jgi:cytochrome c553